MKGTPSPLVRASRHALALGACVSCAALAFACLPDTTRIVTPVAIRFISQPMGTRANAVLPSVSVGFINSSGAVAQNSPGGLVQLTLVTSDTSVHLLGETAADGAYGLAMFSQLSVNKAATGLRLVAKSAGFDSTVSNAFDITP